MIGLLLGDVLLANFVFSMLLFSKLVLFRSRLTEFERAMAPKMLSDISDIVFLSTFVFDPRQACEISRMGCLGGASLDRRRPFHLLACNLPPLPRYQISP